MKETLTYRRTEKKQLIYLHTCEGVGSQELTFDSADEARKVRRIIAAESAAFNDLLTRAQAHGALIGYNVKFNL